MMYKYLGVLTGPVWCTKIASKLTRTYTDRHGLRDICRDLLGVEISKQQQSSDWGAPQLTDEQLTYAASDVLYLHRLKDIFDGLLDREGRRDIAQACFDYLPTRARLDLLGWSTEEISRTSQPCSLAGAAGRSYRIASRPRLRRKLRRPAYDVSCGLQPQLE